MKCRGRRGNLTRSGTKWTTFRCTRVPRTLMGSDTSCARRTILSAVYTPEIPVNVFPSFSSPRSPNRWTPLVRKTLCRTTPQSQICRSDPNSRPRRCLKSWKPFSKRTRYPESKEGTSYVPNLIRVKRFIRDILWSRGTPTKSPVFPVCTSPKRQGDEGSHMG